MREIIIEVPDNFGKTGKPEKMNSTIKGDLVRCKDCKYAVLTYQGELKYCKYFVDEYGFTNGGDPLYLDGDFFCAAGEVGRLTGRKRGVSGNADIAD